MYNYILFDADNTLLDFDKAQLYSFKKVLKRYNCVFSEEIYNKYITINHELWSQFEKKFVEKKNIQERRFADLFYLLGKNVEGAQADDFYQKCLQNQSWLVPYAKETCKALSAKIPLSIVTNGMGKTQITRIVNSEINEFITNIIISEIVGFSKPSKEFFDESLKIIGYKNTDKVLIVGDSISSDILGGINAGIDTCWYNPKKLEPPSGIPINYIIGDLRELIELTGV